MGHLGDMPEFRVATWNMDYWKHTASHEAAWHWLRHTVQPTIALVQEANPPVGFEDVIRREGGIDKRRPWSSAVASFGPRITEVTAWKGAANRTERPLGQTIPGTVAIAKVELPGQEPIVVVSMYGLIRDGYATTAVHQQLTDLNSLLDSRQARRLIIGGDLNCSTQLKPPYRRIHRNLFERFETYGLANVTYHTRDQRPPLKDCPCGDSPACGHVKTHKHNRSKLPWQDDYVFAGPDMVNGKTRCRVIDAGSPSPWEFSDHCPVVATFEL